MKLLTVMGTRPEIIRLSRIIPALDEKLNHTTLFTYQNYTYELSDIFFKDLDMRRLDKVVVGGNGVWSERIGNLFRGIEDSIHAARPDALLVLGDTDTAFVTAYLAKRLNIPLFHMEAGNRCGSDRVPEEINRRLIDNCATFHLPYTSTSKWHLDKENLLWPERTTKCYVMGNPIYEVIKYHDTQINASTVLEQLKLDDGDYFLVTFHRQENVDNPERLVDFLRSMNRLWKTYHCPIIISTHPRLKDKLHKKYTTGDIRFLTPFGFFDFIRLQMGAKCVLTDSGTVQEESCILKVPSVILRDCTERPETIVCGSTKLVGVSPPRVIEGVGWALSRPTDWEPPCEYLKENVAEEVVEWLVCQLRS